MSLFTQLASAISPVPIPGRLNPLGTRVAGGGIGALAGGVLGSLIGGKKAAAFLSLGGGVAGAFAPELLKLFSNKSSPVNTFIDNQLGIVPAVKQATVSSGRATTGTVALARRLARERGEAGRQRALRLLRVEQERLRTSQIQPLCIWPFC